MTQLNPPRASDRYPKGEDPSGLGGEAVERGPEGKRPEDGSQGNRQSGSDAPCVVGVDGYGKVDVVQHYRQHGFDTLPPQLTISGGDLRALAKVPWTYGILGPNGQPLAHRESVVVQHGDRFYAVPPASVHRQSGSGT